MKLAVLKIWSVFCLVWLAAAAADTSEKPNVVIMLMDDVSCEKSYKSYNRISVGSCLLYVSLFKFPRKVSFLLGFWHFTCTSLI